MRVGALIGTVAMAVSVAGATGADAKGRHGPKRSRAVAARPAYSPPYADMVVDVRTGRVMHAVAENELRHPASVTKVMTLYMLFDRLQRGQLQLDSELTVSRRSAAMAPSKLGLRPGETIKVEDAIKAIVTRSANDVAATIAENLGGSEDAFAAQMTRKARQLGMKRTVYRNASGLPNPEQVTTAHDLTILARAVQEKFPRYYGYFQTRSFAYRGQVIGNHNHLLGRVEGVDGIKTGFTNASGFNLMTSARLDGRHVVGVVLGGRSAASRDNIMANLIRSNLAKASPTGNSSVFAELDTDDDGPLEAAADRLASADVDTTASIARQAPPSSSSDLPTTRAAATAAMKAARAMPKEAVAYASAEDEPAVAAEVEAPLLPARKIDGRLPFSPATPSTAAAPGRVSDAPVRPQPAPAKLASVEPAKAVREAPKAVAATPWVIQLAAEDSEGKARTLLDEAKARSGRLLARAEPFTEKVVRGNATLYRARFSGFSEPDDAQDACKALKRSGYSCFATRS